MFAHQLVRISIRIQTVLIDVVAVQRAIRKLKVAFAPEDKAPPVLGNNWCNQASIEELGIRPRNVPEIVSQRVERFLPISRHRGSTRVRDEGPPGGRTRPPVGA